MADPVDLLVLGGGTAGIVGSKTAARLGERTVLVESGRTGGDCLWTGCVPSKTLLSAGKDAAEGHTDTGFEQARERIAASIKAIEPEDSPESLEAAGVSVISGSVRFTGAGEAEVGGKRISFRQALIATGSFPTVPPIPGLDDARTVTSETVWDLKEMPGRMVIVGGGPIACELGQAFARLGSRVTILAGSGILSKETRKAAALVRTALAADGVVVAENESAEHVETAPGGGSTVHTSRGNRFSADVILVAAGRTARTEGLGLDAVDVECDDKGQILVDSAMRTSNKSIWAAGDVTQNPKFTHLAGVHASTAASNAILGLHRSVSAIIPRVTFTSPEVAAVGVTEASTPGQTLSTVDLSTTDRAITEGSPAGFAQLVIGKRGRILGGTIVGPRAGESLGELTLAVEQGMSTRQLAGVTHPYPTYNDAVWNAAISHAQSSLDSPAVKAAVRLLSVVARLRNGRR
ncbi:FAD-dependent oxidoreductase [Arthrobacter tumbae]|uniref:dihydrolipoyl dehydrogenase family protein n=1 Tax=Arthrobacter tumbae TaxID=163874 RepID=UPI00195CEF31|nr:FAD-dependent oxidoreductase [Arthrobacter tumbae]MBM7780868.1 pyruvate/2-oxoglutarate dehydrogenase complex dihydrolipoamide dehydrogenase (E3) component [Arthrobacter tumbae]